MPAMISPEALTALIAGDDTCALIDVRESAEYNSAHIPGSSSLPRRQLEFQIGTLVPFRGERLILCDDDQRRADLAAATLQRIGYTQVSVLDGGLNRWTTEGYPNEWGINVQSKDFGEKMEVVHHISVMEPKELLARQQRGEKLVLLDSRTPEEHTKSTIPGSRSVPGAELTLRISDIVKDPETTIVVHCAGRTRSIVGARALQRMGLDRVYDLKNGTMGWLMAGLELESGSQRLDLPEPSPEGLAKAEAHAMHLANEDTVQHLGVSQLQELMARADRETVYLIDVRTEDEYVQGHISGFRWFPGGQAVQRSDDVAAVRNGKILFVCDGTVRSTVTASWYRQMGFPNVYAVDGGTAAWVAAGLALETGATDQLPFGLAEARAKVGMLSPADFEACQFPTLIFVDTSRDFAGGHVPGSHWVPRGWLEDRIESVAPDKDEPVGVTCSDGLNSALAAATLLELGYSHAWVLGGGVEAWRQAAFPLEAGLTGVMNTPTDVLLSGTERTFAEMLNYLRWEEALGKKYEVHTE